MFVRSSVQQPSRRSWLAILAVLLIALLCAAPAFAQAAAPAAPVAAPAAPNVGDGLDRALNELGGGEQPLALSLQVLILMALLTVLPSLLLMMTSFTRIIIVLSILRQALGLQQTPPNQVLVGLSFFLTLFIMAPTITTLNSQAVAPYSASQIGATEAIERGGNVMHGFMIKQTRKTDIAMFSKIANTGPYAKANDVPFSVLLPSFVTSELKTAFQIGFLIFLPFIVIDLVVASVLMALGMMMLSPTIISLPFKLLLFVLVDGWALTMGSLASSFVS